MEVAVSLSGTVSQRQSDKMPSLLFRLMCLTFAIVDFLYPHLDRRIARFGIKEGMTVVDYGCGPGRYTTRFSRLVRDMGKVFAVDIHELAIEAVKAKAVKHDLANVEPILVSGYDSTIPDHEADITCAIDMFFLIREPTEFLGELRRITKKEGFLIIDDGHQSREATKRKIADSGHWVVREETRDHLKCTPA